MLGMTTQYGWRTIPGGTSRYIAPLIEPFKHQIFLNRTPIRVERQADRVNLIFADGTLQSFDHVVLACPAPMRSIYLAILQIENARFYLLSK